MENLTEKKYSYCRGIFSLVRKMEKKNFLPLIWDIFFFSNLIHQFESFYYIFEHIYFINNLFDIFLVYLFCSCNEAYAWKLSKNGNMGKWKIFIWSKHIYGIYVIYEEIWVENFVCHLFRFAYHFNLFKAWVGMIFIM